MYNLLTGCCWMGEHPKIRPDPSHYQFHDSINLLRDMKSQFYHKENGLFGLSLRAILI